jgi:hypothetical protein
MSKHVQGNRVEAVVVLVLEVSLYFTLFLCAFIDLLSLQGVVSLKEVRSSLLGPITVV